MSAPRDESMSQAQRQEESQGPPLFQDARYDTPQQRCACGSPYFHQLTVVQVHAQAGVPGATSVHGLPPLAPQPHLPVFSCVACGTHYDRHWHPII